MSLCRVFVLQVHKSGAIGDNGAALLEASIQIELAPRRAGDPDRE
jgi:hypothetical protein